MVATFSETRAFTSRDHVEKWVQEFQNDQKNFLQSNYSGCFFSIFASKMLISDGICFFKKTFVATSSEASSLTPRKCFPEEGKSVRK